MNSIFISFLNAYFNMIQTIPEQWIDLITIMTFFIASMIISIFVCSVVYAGFYFICKVSHY